MKELKNIDGISAKSNAIPAVSPNDINEYLVISFLFSFIPELSTSFNDSIARRGIVNSAMTSIEATVRNLAYIGT